MPPKMRRVHIVFPNVNVASAQREPQAFFAGTQGLDSLVPGDGDCGNMGGDVDQAQVSHIGAAGRAEVHREGPEHPALRIENRRRPTGSQVMSEGEFAITIPQRVRGYVFDNDRLAPEGCSAAGTGPRADRFAIDAADECFRKVPRRTVPHMNPIGVQQEDRAEHTRALRLDHAQQQIQDFWEVALPAR